MNATDGYDGYFAQTVLVRLEWDYGRLELEGL